MANGPESQKTSKPLCFVVGPIGKDGSPERRHADLLLNAVIKNVLEQEEFSYNVKRADEDADPGMIGDRVISDIVNAELVVADLTDLNPNAFYELGIRHSTEKPTIHIAKSGTQLPFDNVAHRTIFVDLMDWHSSEQARARLADSARAIKRPSYKVSNPITQATASFKMRQSEDPRDQFIAQMNERLSALENLGPSASRSLRLSEDNQRRLYAQFIETVRIMKKAGSTEDVIEQALRRTAAAFGLRSEFGFGKKEVAVATSDGVVYHVGYD